MQASLADMAVPLRLLHPDALLDPGAGRDMKAAVGKLRGTEHRPDIVGAAGRLAGAAEKVRAEPAVAVDVLE